MITYDIILILSFKVRNKQYTFINIYLKKDNK